MTVPDEPRDAFAKRMNMWLRHNGYDWQWLADEIGVAKSTAWKWSTGKGEPRLYMLRRIASVVGSRQFLWMIGIDNG